MAIVAHYDTLSAAPVKGSGANENGSGLAGLLELSRLFSKVYGTLKNRVGYNLMFIVTGGSRLNYKGSNLLLDELPSHLISTIDFALCLDSIANDNLYLHYSRPKDASPLTKSLYTVFEDTAREMKVDLTLMHKKINIRNPNLSWEHEAYARKRILAMTLSGNKKANRLCPPQAVDTGCCVENRRSKSQ